MRFCILKSREIYPFHCRPGGFFFCTKSRRIRRELGGRRVNAIFGGTSDLKKTHPNSHTRFGDYDFTEVRCDIKKISSGHFDSHNELQKIIISESGVTIGLSFFLIDRAAVNGVYPATSELTPNSA